MSNQQGIIPENIADAILAIADALKKFHGNPNMKNNTPQITEEMCMPIIKRHVSEMISARLFAEYDKMQALKK